MLTRTEAVHALNPRDSYAPMGALPTRVQELTSVRECMSLAPHAVNARMWTESVGPLNHNIGEHEQWAEDWYGAPSRAEAIARGEQGWVEGWARVRDALRALSLPALPKRRKMRFADDGPDLNLDRYLDGADICWNVRRRVPVATVDCTVSMGATGDVKASALFWRGAACVALVDALERSGYRVRLTALSMSARSFTTGEASLTRVRMKDYAEPLRPGHLAGAICAPVLFRIGAFGARCTEPVNVDSGFGTTCEPTGSALGLLHVPHSVLSKETAQAFLAKLARDNFEHGRLRMAVHASRT